MERKFSKGEGLNEFRIYHMRNYSKNKKEMYTSSSSFSFFLEYNSNEFSSFFQGLLPESLVRAKGRSKETKHKGEGADDIPTSPYSRYKLWQNRADSL